MLGEEFSDLPPKRNINKLSLNKIKNFCSQKDFVKRKKKISYRMGESICT